MQKLLQNRLQEMQNRPQKLLQNNLEEDFSDNNYYNPLNNIYNKCRKKNNKNSCALNSECYYNKKDGCIPSYASAVKYGQQ